jgi:hypothetical protein
VRSVRTGHTFAVRAWRTVRRTTMRNCSSHATYTQIARAHALRTACISQRVARCAFNCKTSPSACSPGRSLAARSCDITAYLYIGVR